MNDHICEGWSCKCMDEAVYKPPRRSKYRAASTPFSQSIPGSKGEQGIGTRSHPGDVPLTAEGQAFLDRLWRATDISLRDHPQRWREQKVIDTRHHVMTPLEEQRRRQGPRCPILNWSPSERRQQPERSHGRFSPPDGPEAVLGAFLGMISHPVSTHLQDSSPHPLQNGDKRRRDEGARLPKYLFRLTRQMTVDGEIRQPGDAVPEAASWPNLRHYESLGWVERVPVPEDFDGGVEYPVTAPTSRLAEVLEPEREPTPVTVAWKRKTGASVAIRCVNCRKRNWLPTDFLETATWMCHFCGQAQTVIEAEKHPAPTSLGEWVESFDAAAVDDDGALKWVPGAGAAAASAAGVKELDQ